MTNMIHYQFNTRKKKYGQGVSLTHLNEKMGKDVIGFHKKLPAYTVTPLHSLPHLSQRLGNGANLLI